MKQRIACLILMLCFATISGESVSCGKSCEGGPMSWGTLGHLTCCPAGYSMVIIHGKCSCHSPPPDSASSSNSSNGGSVMMVSGLYNRTQLKDEMQQLGEDMRRMTRWIRANLGPGGR